MEHVEQEHTEEEAEVPLAREAEPALGALSVAAACGSCCCLQEAGELSLGHPGLTEPLI